MKKIFYYSAAIVFTLLSCKDDKTPETDGFVIEGKMNALPAGSLAMLSYKQQDSTITDTLDLIEGSFTFKGKVKHPSEASISVRHGNNFPEKAWLSDSYHFYIENTEMQLTAKDSVKNATLKGSVLSDEALEVNNLISPLTDEIIALYDRMKGRTSEEKMITYDTIQIYVDSIKGVAHNFIMSHPDSYVSLQRFMRHEMPKNFDPIEADKNFNTLFNKNLQQTPLGKSIAEKIAIEKKSQIGVPAIDFSQKTVDDKDFKLSSLRGKYVLIDFWASWCKPCRAENPFVVKAYNTYKDKNFEIVGVSLDAGKEQWVEAIEKDGLPWIHVSDLKYWKNDVAVQYGINSVPANVLVDPDGIIIAKNLRGEALTDRLSEIFNSKI